MYDKVARERRAKRVIRVFANYYGKTKLNKMMLLDVGSSTGIIDNVLAASFKKVVGVDIDTKAVAFAKKRFRKRNLNFNAMDSMKLSFNDNTFDAVVCMQVYEHVPDAKKLFKEIRRVLKPNGVCYLSAINRLWPWEPHYNLFFLSWLPKPLANIYLRLTGKAKYYYESPLSYWGLKKILAGFKVIEYTSKIIRDPKHFLYPDIPAAVRFIVSFPAKVLAPSFIWLLIKK